MKPGLISIRSRHPFAETVKRLIATLPRLHLEVFGRVDHAKAAKNVGLELRPTELIIFGNPKGGTPLMQEEQTAGIDLPLKLLVWEDEAGKIWISYNDPQWIAERHGLRVDLAALDTATRKLIEFADVNYSL